MKIIFQFEETGETLSYQCGWSTGKEILEFIWKKLTEDIFNRKVETDNKKLNNVFKKKEYDIGGKNENKA